MNCQSFQENVTDLIGPGTDPERVTALEAHAAACPACAAWLAEMRRTRDALRPLHRVEASTRFKEGVMKRIREMEESEKMEAVRPRRVLRWRPALAVAAALIIACAALLSLYGKGGNKAYALERIIEATRGLRFIHIMKMDPVEEGSAGEVWAQFDGQAGKLVQMRLDFPHTEDGPKVVLWQAGKATVWFKKKNSLLTVSEPALLERMKMSARDFDPRQILEGLYNKSKAGKVRIQSTVPAGVKGLFNLVVTGVDDSSWREVYTVDLATRLVSKIEKYRQKDGKEERIASIKYLDYNNPAVAEAFKIEPPKDVIPVDQTAREIGLAKGNLDDKTIAIKVASEFFEALVAEDYDKAGLLMEGIPGARLKGMLNGLKFVRIVKIGDAVPHPIPSTGGLQVPCEVEMEKDGKKATQTFKLGVREVYNHPDRWDIFGGF